MASERAVGTAREVHAARATGTASRRRRLPRQQPPKTLARDYAAALRRIVDLTRQALQPLLDELPDLLRSSSRERADSARADAGEGRRVRQLVDQARDRIARSVRPADIEKLAEEFARKTATYQRVQLSRQVKAALGADVFIRDRRLAGLVDGFVSENVSLIRSLPEEVLSKIERSVTRAVTSGTPHPELARQIQDEVGVGERRARLIARDQVGKFYGQVNESRQREMGVDGYVWRTARDARVRPEHEDREGQSFKWTEPPDDGHPGQAIQCRCYSEPNFATILEELE